MDLIDLDIAAAAAAVRDRSLSAAELARFHLERIVRLDPRFHAFYHVAERHALAQAASVDAAIASGRDPGPLAGVPIALKDIVDTAFAPSTGGLSHRIGHVPARSAALAERLEAAGAVVLGKLATTEGAYMDHNPAWPVPVNPWSAAHWTGVSSSGSGVAVAARLCLGAVGSDTGGSIRMPSAACGITGLKPGYGSVSGRGVLPLAHALDHFGPMARSAADCAAMFAAMAGPDAEDVRTARAQAQGDPVAALAGGAQGRQIGVDRKLVGDRVSAPVAAALDAALAVLAARGARIVEVRWPDPAPAIEAFGALVAKGAAEAHAASFDRHEAGYSATLAALVRSGRAVDHAMLERARDLQRQWRAAFDALLGEVDMFALPVFGDVVPRLDALAQRTASTRSGFADFTIPFDVGGHPTVTLPAGCDDAGLPIALQLAGPHGGEATLLAAAHAFQQETDWHRRLTPAAR